MADEPLRQYPKGTLGYDIQQHFRNAAGKAFENVPSHRDPTNAELASAVKALWTATEHAFQELVDRAGNPPSKPAV